MHTDTCWHIANNLRKLYTCTYVVPLLFLTFFTSRDLPRPSAPSSSKSSAVGLQSEIDFDLSNRSVPINKHKNNVITDKYRSIQRLHQGTVVFPHSTAIRHIPVRFPVNCPSAAYKRFDTQPEENNVRFKAYYTYLTVNLFQKKTTVKS